MIEYNGLDNPECYSKDEQQPGRKYVDPVRLVGSNVLTVYHFPEPLTYQQVLYFLQSSPPYFRNRIKSVTFELAEW